MNKIHKSFLVKKANGLIEASYKLSLNEQKVILTLASMIKKEDEDFKRYQIKVTDFIKILELKGESKYSELKKLTKTLMKKVFTIETKESTLQISWFSSTEYIKNKGLVEFEFSPKLKPYLLMLKENFTMYELENVLKLKSVYAIRIYELLKQYQKIGNRVLSIDQMKYILDIEDKYKLYHQFKQRVLQVAHKEINQNTDVHFEFEEIKLGRKVDKIKFIIKSKKTSQPNTNNYLEEIAVTTEDYEDEKAHFINPYIEELKKVLKEDLTHDELEAILNVADNNIEKIKEKYEISRVSTYENLVGFLISAIIKDYKVRRVSN